MNYKNVVIVTHEATSGPAHDIREYLLPKTETLLYIAHPLLFVKSTYQNNSYFEIYKNGKLLKRRTAFHFQGPEVFHYIKDSILTLIWVLFSLKYYDLFIGNGNINAFMGIVLKILGRVKCSVFYCIDYVPKRFENAFINKLYHLVDKLSVERSDITWNLSPRMAEGRNKKWKKDFPKQITVPIGAWFNRIRRYPLDKINKTQLIYMGAILKTSGIQLVISALPEVIKHIPQASFIIIGTGPYLDELKLLVKKLNLNKRVSFTGYIKDHKEIENMIAECALAMAMYDPYKNPFTYYADPGKVKNYLAAGVPVFITDLPYVARQVTKAKCGIIVEYKKASLAKNITELLKDENKLKEYRKSALKFAKKYDWNMIFDQALNNSQ